MPSRILIFAFVALISSPLLGATPDPLFLSDDLLAITLTGPFSTLDRERDKGKRYEGSRLSIADPAAALDVGIALGVRGNFRRDKRHCRFPPLKIYFDKSAVKGTLLDKQEELKLVTNCQPQKSSHEQYLLKEYLAYRLFNTLTDYSYKVRLLEVTYIDTDDENSRSTAYGFFIEDTKRLRKRHNADKITANAVPPEQLEPAQANLVSLFQFMIGNTDWSILQGTPDESCCHNAKLIAPTDSLYLAVPYDFDFSGLVNARYAFPNPKFKLRNVRQRLFRGFCQPASIFESNRQLMLARQDAMFSLVDSQQGLNKRARKQAQSYLSDFFAIASDPQRFQKSVVDTCRGELQEG